MKKGDKGMKVWGVFVFLLIGLILSPSVVQAVYQCGDQTDTCSCGKVNPMPCCDNNCNGVETDVCDGNCGWWAWDQACCEWGVGLPGSVSKWDDGRTYSRTVPVIGAIAIRCGVVQESGGDIRCAPGELKHTAYVVWVSGDKNYVKVSEMNCWNPNGGPCDKCSGQSCSDCETTGHSYRYHTYPSSWFSYYIYPPGISPPTEAPTHVYPPSGATDVSLTPTFQWGSVANADYYALFISEPPYGAAHLVFDSEDDYGNIYGTSFNLADAGISLDQGVTYHWDMRAWNEGGHGPISSDWSFTTIGVCPHSCWDRSALSGNELAALVRNQFPLGGVTQTDESIRVTAYAVAKAESGGNPSACGDIDVPAPGHMSIGLWQINTYWHPNYDRCSLFEEDYNANVAKEISNNGKDWNPWTAWKNEAYKTFLTEARKHFYPKVNSLSVSSTSISSGESVKIYYSVSDDVGLSRVELWRAIDVNGDGQPDWPEAPQDVKPASDQSASDYFEDAPSSPDTYWYGIHVVDNSGAPEAWNDEKNSRTGNLPGVYGPDKVVVTLAQRTITFSTDPTNGGTITFAGSTYSNGQSITKPDGPYSVSANPASNYVFDHWTTTGGVSVANPNSQSTTATVSGDGSIKAWFTYTPPQRTITFSTDPTNGGTITFAGSTYSNGQSITKPDGPYSVSANPASNYVFDHWTTTGGVSVANPNSQSTTATVSGDGSIKAWFKTKGVAITATRSISPQQVMNGSTFTVTVTVVANQTIYALILDEAPPTGWSVTPVQNDGATFKEPEIKWLWTESLSKGDSKTVIYNVTIPSDTTPGDTPYTITGNVSAYGIEPITVGGDNTITVIIIDWNPWDDDGIITDSEIQEAVYHWLTDTPKNDHLITDSEIQELVYMWLTG